MDARRVAGETPPQIRPACTGAGCPGSQVGPERGWLPVQLCLQAATRLFARHLKRQTALLLTLSPDSIVVIGRQPPAASQAVNTHFRSAHTQPSVFKARKGINKTHAPPAHLLSSAQSPHLVPPPKLPPPGRCCSVKLCHNDSTGLEKSFFFFSSFIWFCRLSHHQNCSRILTTPPLLLLTRQLGVKETFAGGWWGYCLGRAQRRRPRLPEQHVDASLGEDDLTRHPQTRRSIRWV